MPALRMDKKEFAFAAMVVLLLTLLGVACDNLLHGRIGMLLGDFLPALAAGVLFCLMRMHQRLHTRLTDERLQIMRETIDHIRNAMQIVVYSLPNEGQKAAIDRLMQGIDSTLRYVGGQTSLPEQLAAARRMGQPIKSPASDQSASKAS